MPTWGELIPEIQKEIQTTGPVAYDIVRRKYLGALSEHTGRNTILYATAWTSPGADPSLTSISEEDIVGFMEVIYQLKGPLDLILHSPGGSPEATEAIVGYLRSKFTDIRVIVPHVAMSAATMLACAANRIMMGRHSYLGPIDPQFILSTPLGQQVIAAQAILDQFQQAQRECQDSSMATSWFPILGQYGPALIIQCTNAIALAKELVERWLHEYMFAGSEPNPASEIAGRLSSHTDFKSHGRHISLVQAQRMGLIVDALEDDHELQGKVLSVFHATTHTFNGTGAAKIIENQLGRAFVKLKQQLMIPQQMHGIPIPRVAPVQPQIQPVPPGPT